MTIKTRRETCQTIPNLSNNRITTGRHNFPADTAENGQTIDLATEFKQTTAPNLRSIPTTPEITNHQLHSPNHPEPAPTPTHSSIAINSTTAFSPTIRHDLSTEQSQAIWANYHAIQKQLEELQATLQSAIDLLQRDRITPTLPEVTTPSEPPSDRPHQINHHVKTLADSPTASQIPTVLLFDIAIIYRLPP